MKGEPFEMELRGHWCRIYGRVEPADPAVGILVPHFCVDEIQEYGYKGGGGRLYSDDEVASLSGTELADIDGAYWAQGVAPCDQADDGAEDLTAGPSRARIGGPAFWLARIGRWLGALTGRRESVSFYEYEVGQKVVHAVHGEGRVTACRSSAGIKAGGTPQYLVKFVGRSLLHCEEAELRHRTVEEIIAGD